MKKIFYFMLLSTCSVNSFADNYLIKEFEKNSLEIKNIRANGGTREDITKYTKGNNEILSGSVSKNQYASDEERIIVLNDFYQKAIVTRHLTEISVAIPASDRDPEHKQRHLSALSVMQVGMEALADNPLLGIKRRVLFDYLKQKRGLNDIAENYLKDDWALKTLFPKGFFLKSARFSYNFNDYKKQDALETAMAVKVVTSSKTNENFEISKASGFNVGQNYVKTFSFDNQTNEITAIDSENTVRLMPYEMNKGTRFTLENLKNLPLLKTTNLFDSNPDQVLDTARHSVDRATLLDLEDRLNAGIKRMDAILASKPDQGSSSSRNSVAAQPRPVAARPKNAVQDQKAAPIAYNRRVFNQPAHPAHNDSAPRQGVQDFLYVLSPELLKANADALARFKREAEAAKLAQSSLHVASMPAEDNDLANDLAMIAAAFPEARSSQGSSSSRDPAVQAVARPIAIQEQPVISPQKQAAITACFKPHLQRKGLNPNLTKEEFLGTAVNNYITALRNAKVSENDEALWATNIEMEQVANILNVTLVIHLDYEGFETKIEPRGHSTRTIHMKLRGGHYEGFNPITKEFTTQVLGDGNCFYNVVIKSLHGGESSAEQVARLRNSVANNIAGNPAVKEKILGYFKTLLNSENEGNWDTNAMDLPGCKLVDQGKLIWNIERYMKNQDRGGHRF